MDSFHEYQDITPQLDYFIQHSTYSNLGCALMTVTPKNELSSRYLTAVAEIGHFEWRGKHGELSESFFDCCNPPQRVQAKP